MSKKFEEVKQLNFSKVEVETLKWWKKNDIFEKSVSTREEGIPFTFMKVRLPPTASPAFTM